MWFNLDWQFEVRHFEASLEKKYTNQGMAFQKQ